MAADLTDLSGLNRDLCSIAGASGQSASHAFQCITKESPDQAFGFFVGLSVLLLLIWWLRLNWQALKARNKGKYDWDDVMLVFTRPLALIIFLVAFFLFIRGG